VSGRHTVCEQEPLSGNCSGSLVLFVPERAHYRDREIGTFLQVAGKIICDQVIQMEQAKSGGIQDARFRGDEAGTATSERNRTWRIVFGEEGRAGIKDVRSGGRSDCEDVCGYQ
jgi:hypothetical protein